ncbi:MAG: shikimate dehydrogenase, partial [Desulfurivibrionaceae bacterium]
VLVNATSVGMAPAPENTPVPAEILSGYRAVMDIVYSPLETRLLREAAGAGCRVASGLAMLLYQGAAQFELWTGRPPPIEAMRQELDQCLKK